MSKPICHVMIDLETLSLKPNAAVIQAGITYRTMAGNLAEFEYSCSPVLYRDRTHQFDIDQGTLQFHKKENMENLERCMNAEMSIEQVAQAILTAIETAKEGGQRAIWLWCCGTDFDIPILRNLLECTELKANWSYSNVRDYRTLRELYKDVVPKEYKNDHRALNDARNQYNHLMCILDYMEGGRLNNGK